MFDYIKSYESWRDSAGIVHRLVWSSNSEQIRLRCGEWFRLDSVPWVEFKDRAKQNRAVTCLECIARV